VLGGAYVALGALAGILGATALGIVASSMGGTNRLITAPCAPAAAVLAAFAIEGVQQGLDPAVVVVTLLSAICSRPAPCRCCSAASAWAG
jgi:SulP family sulfate permease